MISPRVLRLALFSLFVLLFVGGIVFYEQRVAVQSSQQQNPEAVKKAQEFAAKCRENHGWRDCYGDLFFSLNKVNPLSFSLSVLNVLQNIDVQTRDCHILAHKMMQAEVAKDPKHWQDVLKKISYTSCNYGFVHGLMEGVSRYDKTFQINEKTIPQICALMVKDSPHSGIDQTCSHIFGHLLLTDNYIGDVPGSIAVAVPVCDKLSNILQHECYAGIFMESFTRDNLVYEGLTGRIAWNTPPVIAQQEQLCRQYQPPQSYGCWQEISHMYNAEFPNQPDKVWESCNYAPDTTDRNYCYLHAVATLVNNRNADSGYFASLCQPFADDAVLYGQCTGTAVFSILYASIRNVDIAASYCSALSEKQQKDCYSKVIRGIHQLVSPQKRAQFCAQIPQAYQKSCLNN